MVEKKEIEFVPSKVFEIYKPKYHQYHKTFYNTENVKSIGIHGDKPVEKFTNDTQKFNGQSLQYSDNYNIGLGSTKTTCHIPGYSGFIPKNSQPYNYSKLADPFTNVGNTNHMLNYKIRVPRYGGYISTNSNNIKGNPRPFCLTTKGETFG